MLGPVQLWQAHQQLIVAIQSQKVLRGLRRRKELGFAVRLGRECAEVVRHAHYPHLALGVPNLENDLTAWRQVELFRGAAFGSKCAMRRAGPGSLRQANQALLLALVILARDQIARPPRFETTRY